MASRTKIIGDQFLSFIYNVSQPVGPGKPNLPDDVMLLQFLLRTTLPRQQPSRIRSPFPPLNGIWDLATGFWTYETQFLLDRNLKGRATIDGVASPVREGTNGTYGGGKIWTIMALNRSLKTNFPGIFDGLPDHPDLSPSLRVSIGPFGSPLPATRK